MNCSPLQRIQTSRQASLEKLNPDATPPAKGWGGHALCSSRVPLYEKGNSSGDTKPVTDWVQLSLGDSCAGEAHGHVSEHTVTHSPVQSTARGSTG